MKKTHWKDNPKIAKKSQAIRTYKHTANLFFSSHFHVLFSFHELAQFTIRLLFTLGVGEAILRLDTLDDLNHCATQELGVLIETQPCPTYLGQ